MFSGILRSYSLFNANAIELNYNKEREIFRAMLVIMTNSKIVEQQRLSSVKHQTSFHSN